MKLCLIVESKPYNREEIVANVRAALEHPEGGDADIRIVDWRDENDTSRIVHEMLYVHPAHQELAAELAEYLKVNLSDKSYIFSFRSPIDRLGEVISLTVVPGKPPFEYDGLNGPKGIQSRDVSMFRDDWRDACFLAAGELLRYLQEKC